jgi:hypothetical protein
MMRRFHSYGPVDAEQHFCVSRQALVDRCIDQLVGHPDKGGSFFTIWAARQSGKTWLLRQALQEIPRRYGEQFAVHFLSLGNVHDLEYTRTHLNEDIGDVTVPGALSSILQHKLPGNPQVPLWKDFVALFNRQGGVWDRPVILLLDEVDSVPALLLDMLVRRFRELYLDRTGNWLHGLALVGVRAVVGVESHHGSPFNVQRSLHVPNLTPAEVRDMYQQYQAESGQTIEPAVVENVYEVTHGQPGLVSWFGELLTETYNKTPDQPIGMETWKYVWVAARFVEPNNNVMNLIAKARMPAYQGFLLELFKNASVPFQFHHPLHNYLYMQGIVEPTITHDMAGELVATCRFTSPFIQDCIYQALGDELVAQSPSVLALHPLDRLDDVFEPPALNVPALLRRYKEYLVQLKAAGINPWKAQPRRESDRQLTEAVGHFHLYAWLQQAIGQRCVISPEFPTGSGKVDLHLRCADKRALIEVKSFGDIYQLERDKPRAADYARHVGLAEVTMAVFISVLDDDVLAQLAGTDSYDGVQVHVVMIGWF